MGSEKPPSTTVSFSAVEKHRACGLGEARSALAAAAEVRASIVWGGGRSAYADDTREIEHHHIYPLQVAGLG